jgi:hypothetical protein
MPAEFVKLHLPLPVMESLITGRDFFSTTAVFKPHCPASAQAIIPAGPAPMIRTS